jgi:chromosome segregation ATPase
LDRWPEVEQALSAVRSLQSHLSELQGTLEELKRQVGTARSNPDPRVDALQAQLTALEQQLTERNEAIVTLQGELRGLRTLNWGMLSAVLLLFFWQLGQLLRRSQAASIH